MKFHVRPANGARIQCRYFSRPSIRHNVRAVPMETFKLLREDQQCEHCRKLAGLVLLGV